MKAIYFCEIQFVRLIALAFANDVSFWMRGKSDRGPNDTHCHFGIKYKRNNSSRGFKEASRHKGVCVVTECTCV